MKCKYYDCSGLTSFTIPNSVTNIGSSVFSGCTGLTSIIIPNNVTNIEGAAFSRCSSLTTVTSLNTIPPTIKSDSFDNYTATLKVPVDSRSAYAAAEYWSNFKDIVEIETAVSGDANGDGVVDVADVMAIVNYILNKPGENFNETAADVNGDGAVNVADVVAVLNTIR